jgi:hypothetical protein
MKLLLVLLLLLLLQQVGEGNSDVVLMREACYRWAMSVTLVKGEGWY